MKTLPYLSAIALFVSDCKPSPERINKFADNVHLKIADFQDRRLSDSLYPYFDHEDARYRAAAVKAFGSIQDSLAIERLGERLRYDENVSVRAMAAFALGQINHPEIENILAGALQLENSPTVIREILHAYGSATSAWNLDPSQFLRDSITAAGLAWSIYRAGLRSKADTVANRVARSLLSSGLSENTRLGAAHFFSRGAKDFEDSENALMTAATHDPSDEVRMAAILSLGKIQSDSSLALVQSVMRDEEDSRIIVSSVRALGMFPYQRVRNSLYEAVAHENVNVGIVASEIILNHANEDDWIRLANLTTRVTYWRVLANLYQASLKAESTKVLSDEIREIYLDTSEPFEKAAWLSTLSERPQAHKFVSDELQKTKVAQLRSAAAATLVAMNRSRHFHAGLKKPFLSTYQHLMSTQSDPAVLGIIAMALADSALGYESMLQGAAILYSAKRKLRLPEHIESLQAIEAAIARIEGREGPVAITNRYNHPIDWARVRQIPEDQLAVIQTTRGSIVIRLLVNESPGSVANFIELAQNDYFDNKFVHRVVPNFVVQAGCNRGDGWGSENYSLRSEFNPRHYRAGSVGMASAGKDTEGTQWFITHLATPHLDGRYTIFAEVVSGMPAVHLIGVGDEILDVRVKNFSAR